MLCSGAHSIDSGEPDVRSALASEAKTCLVVALLTMLAPTMNAAAQGTPQATSRPPLPLTLVDPGPIGAATTTALFAQVAIGGGYTTLFTFLNTGGTPVEGNLILTGDNGNPMNATLTSPSAVPQFSVSNDRVLASSIPLTIPPGGARFIAAAPVSAGDPARNGWARVESSGGTLGGVATFQLSNAAGLQTIAGVLSGDALDSATIPVDNDDTGQGRFTGYAVANTGTEDIQVKIVVVDDTGKPVETLNLTQLNPLRPGRQIARFLHQDSPSRVKFKGSMVLIGQGGKKFAVVALVLNQGLFTAIPVIPGKAPSIN